MYIRNTRWIENRPCNREDRNRNNSKNRSWPTSLIRRTNRDCCTIYCDKKAIFQTNFSVIVSHSLELFSFICVFFLFFFSLMTMIVSFRSIRFVSSRLVRSPSPTLPKDGNLFESETFENCFQERLFVNGRWVGNRHSESGYKVVVVFRIVEIFHG